MSQVVVSRKYLVVIPKAVRDADRLVEEKVRSWSEENRDAVCAYNEYVAEHGCLSAEYRQF